MNRRPVLALVWACVSVLLFASCSGGGPTPRASTDVDASATTASLDARAQVRAAYVAARQATGATNPAYAVRAAGGDGFLAVHPTMGMRAELGENGATLSKPGEVWSATLAGARYGCAGGGLAAIERTGAPRVGASPNRVEYAGRAAGAAVDEWYVHGPLGLEQGFTLGESACGGGGEVVIEVRLEGLDAVASRDSGLDLRDARDVVRVRYTDLWARDASGAALAASMDAVPGGIALRVDTRGAKFPVTVDPTAWFQTAELTASDGASADLLGGSVSISGTTAIVGAANHAAGADGPAGAAYVFVQSGTTWTQQAEFTASDSVANDDFGASVALSGTIAVVGAYDHTVGANPQQGAAYVFVQSGTTWTQQAELTASDGAAGDVFGNSVSVSGTTVVVGAADDAQSAAYVFVRSGATWTQQAELTASDGVAGEGFGNSVSVSGTIAIVGSPGHTVGGETEQGAAYVFVRSGTTWTQQQELTANDGLGGSEFGFSVGLSGTVAIVGAPAQTVGGNVQQGAAYIFAQSGSTWTQQAELTANDGAVADYLGWSVGLSGTIAIAGAPDHAVGATPLQGAAYVFVQSGTTWTSQQELAATDGAEGDSFGITSAVSGTTAIVGASFRTVGADAEQGTAYIEGLLPINGSPCSSAIDCGSRFCVSSVCCDTACGPCGDCSSGTCTNLAQGSAGTPACALPFACNGSSATCPTSCAGDPDCVATDYCAEGTCVPAQATGASCTEDRQCANGNCPLSLGVCSGSLANGTACAAADQCETGYCASGVCCNTACAAGPCQACNVSGSVGTCETVPVTSPGSPSCTPYVCNGSTIACPTTCTADAQCSAASYCSAGSCIAKQATGTTCTADDQCSGDTCANGICVGIQANGTTCTAAEQCGSGNCVSGICCNTACLGACATCTTGSCAIAAATRAGAPSCAPYVCDGLTTACPTKCSADAQCTTADYCSGDQCVARLATAASCTADNQCVSAHCVLGSCSSTAANGAACTAGDQCDTGFCVDGFCCNTACAGECQACDVAAAHGLCSQVNGAPHGQRAACPGAGTTCGATCAASGGQQACQYAAGGTTCGSTSCSDQELVASACDGTGTCAPEAATPCPGNFACVGAACMTSCATAGDCASGFDCAGGTCQPIGGSVCSSAHTSTTGVAGDAGSSSDCSPYACVQGTGKCATTCTSVADCVAPNVCNPTGKCVAPVASAGSPGGCTTAPGGTSEGRGTIWLLGAALLAALLRGVTRMNHRRVLALVWACVSLLVFASCSGSGRMPGASAEVDASVTASLDARTQVRAAYVAARQAEAGRDAEYAVRAAAGGDGFLAVHPTMGMRAALGGNGATLSKAGDAWSATLTGARYGCAGGSLAAIERTGAPRIGASPNRVEVAGHAAGAAVDEWYVHGPLGLEQGFTLGESACGGDGGDLVIEVHLSGLEAAANKSGDGLDLRDAGNVVRVQYTDLWARDASGAALASRMDAVPGGIALHVAARGAKFPVTIDPLAWLQTAELTASDGAASDLGGYSVSISGTTAVVGAPVHRVGVNPSQGAAYVFVQSGTTWTQQAELTAGDGVAGDTFGQSVALSGTIAAIGAPGHPSGTSEVQGAAYVFVQSGTTWTQQAELTASDGAANDAFGNTVALSGTIAVVGAALHEVGANGSQGAAYVFVQSGATWTQQQELTASDGAESDGFGTSVGISGTTAIVGAIHHTVGENPDQGAAYIFVRSGATWTQQQELSANDGVAGDELGDSVAISGTLAIASSTTHNEGQGAAYIFVQSGATWTQQQELTASDGEPSDNFGYCVGLSGTTAVVGAIYHTVGSTLQGAAYVFAQSGTTWTQQGELAASDGAGDDLFGFAVSVSGTTAVVGAIRHTVGGNTQQGAAYVDALLLTNGSVCSSDTDCGSGLCVSSVCCNTACGPCGDCSSGTCTNLAQGSAGTPACALPFACNGSSATCPTSCAGDPDCIATDYCAASACVPAHANSASCTEDRQCTSGNCSLAGICSGSSANGTACTAADQCETGYCASGVCCNSACTAGPCQACSVSGSVGTCETVPVTSPGSPSCAPYVCNGSSTGCPTTCTQDAQCSTADYCSAGSCVARQAMGTTCTADDQCASESCASGICVGTQTNGTICTAAEQCGSGNCVSGICCNTTCLGACATCVTGNCGVAPATSAGTPSCTPYACDGTDKTCPTTCTTDAQCTAADYCSGGQCVAKLATATSCTADDQCVSGNCALGLCSGIAEIGAACTANDQCDTGFCVDGFCCNAACAGQCQACDVAAAHGLCSQVNGDPHGRRAACTGAGTTCGATCTANGGQQACQYAASGTTCSTSCSDQELATSVCDGTGTCAPEAATPCPGNFACVGAACKTSCATTSDCASGFGCTGGACQPTGGSVCSGPHTAMNTTGGAGAGGSTDCSPYICQTGTGKCATACTSVADCVAPDVCNPSGKCVAPAASSGSGGGCSAAPGGASEGGGTVWLLGVALLTRRMRRRTPRRTAPGNEATDR